MTPLNIILLTILLLCFISLSWFRGSDAPFVATKSSRIKKLLKLIPLKKGQKFYELGSGDGRIVIEAAKMGANSIGVEESFIRILISKFRTHQAKLKNAHFIHGNIFNQSYQDANVIFIFLLPNGIKKLESKLKSELTKGSILITQTFHFKNWKPYKKILIRSEEPNTSLGKDKLEGEFWFYKV